MAEALGGVSGDIALVPREAVGLKPAASTGIAGNVSALKPREDKPPAVKAGLKLSREASIGEGVKQGNGGDEVVIHVMAFLVFWSVLDLFTLRIIHEKPGKVKPKNRLENASKLYKLHNRQKSENV